MSKEKNTLLALTAAAVLLQNFQQKALADPPDQKITADYRHTHYQEDPIATDKLAEGSADRYIIDVHHVKFKVPLTQETEMTVSALQESMSGASPWYILPDADGNPIQVMSGATIDESRYELGADFRTYHTHSESTISLSYSQENDYISYSAGFSGAWRLNQNLTTFNYGINTSKDYIDATDAHIYTTRPTDEVKNRVGASVGFTHVARKTTVISSAIGINMLDGFLSDTYKLAFVNGAPVHDSRPDSHEQVVWSLSLREYLPGTDSALHIDYRFFSTNWNIESHTLEAGWYKSFGQGWLFSPSLRYYQQTQAAFYAPFYRQARGDGYYSSDYRLSEFDAVSGQVKLTKSFERFYFTLAYETYEASGDNPALLSFNRYSLGAGAKFR